MHEVTSYVKELAASESSIRTNKDQSPEQMLKQILKLRQLIPEPVISHYDRFMKAGKVPIAAVKNGVCHGCFVRLSSGALQQLMRQDDLNLCENCGRYIYLEEEAIEPAETLEPIKAPRQRRARAMKVA